MKASELIGKLVDLIAVNGDLTVCYLDTEFISDSCPCSEVKIKDAESDSEKNKAAEKFFVIE